jgi:hypothetical protein
MRADSTGVRPASGLKKKNGWKLQAQAKGSHRRVSGRYNRDVRLRGTIDGAELRNWNGSSGVLVRASMGQAMMGIDMFYLKLFDLHIEVDA